MARLVDELERHLKATGISPTTFGRAVANDPRLVFDLRRGRQPRAEIRHRVLSAIGGEKKCGR